MGINLNGAGNLSTQAEFLIIESSSALAAALGALLAAVATSLEWLAWRKRQRQPRTGEPAGQELQLVAQPATRWRHLERRDGSRAARSPNH